MDKPELPTFVQAMLAFFDGSGLAEYEGMPNEVRSLASRAVHQFPRAAFSKNCRAFLEGTPVHPRTLEDAGQRLLIEGDAWPGEHDEWGMGQTHVRHLVAVRDAMLALREATATFDWQADALGLSEADRFALFRASIVKREG